MIFDQDSQLRLLSSCANITKHYDLIRFHKNQEKRQKIIYNNPDDFDKNLLVESNDNMIYIRTKEVKIPSKTGQYIRFIIYAPKTKGFYSPNIIVKNARTREVEEVLQFNIEVVDDRDVI